MAYTTVSRTIDAPPDLVFKTISNISNYTKAVPDIVSIELLSDVETGVGTRFREIRTMKGREATTELEVTEFVENDRIRFLADVGGTIWDTVYTVKSTGAQTGLELTMESRPYRFLPRLMNPLMKGILRKALEKDMDCVKVYCEQNQA